MPSIVAGGFVKARVKKIPEGNTFEKTFDSSEMVEIAEIEKKKVQYTWEDTHDFVFMDMTTFEGEESSKRRCISGQVHARGCRSKTANL